MRSSNKRPAPEDVSAGCPKQRRRLCQTPPEPESIYAILRQHSRLRLFVHPLQWTGVHLEHLRCSFVETWERPPASILQPPSHSPPSTAAVTAVTKASFSLTHKAISYSYRVKAWHAVLTSLGLFQICRDQTISFDLGGRHACSLVTEGIFAASDDASAPPALAVLNLHSVARRRDDSVYLKRRHFSKPTVLLQRQRQALLRPDDPIRDPILVAVLIALAQGLASARQRDWEQRYPTVTQRPPQQGDLESLSAVDELCAPVPSLETYTSSDFEVFVIALWEGGLYLYSSSVPAAFLRRLDAPSERIFSDPLVVRHHRLKLKSPKKVGEFLASTIVEVIRGQFRRVHNTKASGDSNSKS